MSLSTCLECGGHIPLGPDATNRCEKCGAFVFGKAPELPQPMNPQPPPPWPGSAEMSDYIKACPFCGGTQIFYDDYQSGSDSWVSHVQCDDENCGSSGHGSTKEDARAAAVLAWNRRAVEAQPPAAQGEGWIACSERMPPHGFYLAYDPRCKRIRLMQWYAQSTPHRWYDEEDNQFHGDITHWMPIPKGPT